MGGDQLWGLAIAIFGAMVLMLVGGFVVPFFVGRKLGRARQWSAAKRNAISFGLGLVGLGAGALAVMATFYEATWAPPPVVRFIVPPGFAHSHVFLLEDAKADAEVVWQGREVPFFGKHATVALPPSGVLRVKALGPIAGRADARVLWSDGAGQSMAGGGPAPKGTGAQTYLMFNRTNDVSSTSPEPPIFDPDALGAYILKQERGG